MQKAWTRESKEGAFVDRYRLIVPEEYLIVGELVSDEHEPANWTKAKEQWIKEQGARYATRDINPGMYSI